jgi:general transcription factor 3C polypeptide 3 (transcription factor C subunit 4)
MNSQNGYFNPWPPEQPPGNRRFLPIPGSFGNVPPTHVGGPQQPINGQQYPIQFPHGQFVSPLQAYQHPQAHLPPLIPLSAVEDLQLPQIPFTSAALPDSFSRTPFVTSGPVVHEGYIPAPGHNEEDDYPDLPPGYGDTLLRNRDWETSDDESAYEDELTFEQQMRALEERDDSEVDKDYSEEDAQHDEGDPAEMELEGGFYDGEERTQPKRGRPATRGKSGTTRGGTTKVSRGGRRGRPPGRGRGGHSGSVSTRGKKPRGPGRLKGKRGPRAVADPGQDFKELQRQANDRYIAGDYPAAIEYAQQAIQLNPEIFDAHNIASVSYGMMGEEVKSIDSLIIGAPTKRDPDLWHSIIDRIKKVDEVKNPTYTEAAKTALILVCLKEIVQLDKENYDARRHVFDIEAGLGHSSKCVKHGLFMLGLRRDNNELPDTEVMKTMAMLGTSTPKQTRLHLTKLLDAFDLALEVFTKKKPEYSDVDWELINIYLDLLDRGAQYDHALLRLKTLSRWMQGRSKETYWDEQKDDREFDIEDEPRRVLVSDFKRKSQDAKFGQTLPIEIRVKLGVFRLRKSAADFTEAMVRLRVFWFVEFI